MSSILSGLTGLLSMKPWASSHPRRWSSASCSGVSMPSPTVTMPSAWAMPITCSTMAVSSADSPSPLTKERSILSMSRLKLRM